MSSSTGISGCYQPHRQTGMPGQKSIYETFLFSTHTILCLLRFFSTYILELKYSNKVKCVTSLQAMSLHKKMEQFLKKSYGRENYVTIKRERK